jgi:hypothetical protein
MSFQPYLYAAKIIFQLQICKSGHALYDIDGEPGGQTVQVCLATPVLVTDAQ